MESLSAAISTSPALLTSPSVRSGEPNERNSEGRDDSCKTALAMLRAEETQAGWGCVKDPGRRLCARSRGRTLMPSLSPGSPSLSFVSSMETHVPPSPTLSTQSSVHFASTTLALRDNKPEEKSGMSSLNLLSPTYGHQHRRKGSIASSMDGSAEGTEPNSHSITLQLLTPQHTGVDASMIMSPNQTHHDGASDVDGKTLRSRLISWSKGDDDTHSGKGADAGEEEEDEPHPAVDLTQDEEIDAGSFPVKPYLLVSLVDPKSLDALREMGGVCGLLKALGTHRKHGLSKKALAKATDTS